MVAPAITHFLVGTIIKPINNCFDKVVMSPINSRKFGGTLALQMAPFADILPCFTVTGGGYFEHVSCTHYWLCTRYALTTGCIQEGCLLGHTTMHSLLVVYRKGVC